MTKKLLLLTCLVIVLSAISTTSAALVAYYKLDETSGMIATDSSGNGFDGTISGDPTWDAGHKDGALNFNGDDAVTLPADQMGMTSEEGTVAFWINRPGEDFAGINTIWWGGDNTTGGGFGPENEMHIMIEQPGANIWLGGEFGFYSYNTPICHCHSDPEKGDATQPGNAPVDPFLVNDGEWHHIAGTWSMTTSAQVLYYDGSFVQQGVYGTVVYPLDHMYLGQMANASRTLTGLLDEVRIYDRALDEREIIAAMQGVAVNAYTAFKPDPGDGAVEVAQDVVLGWKPGDFSTGRNVYLGTSLDDVNEASVDDPRGVLAAENLTELSFDPPGLLDYGVTYYWRVDELNEAEAGSPWKGNVWSFTVLNYPIIIDDFESYTDFSPDEVWNTWIDGYGDATNGSTAGYPDPDFVGGGHYVETDIVHSGEQSLPLFYDNAAGLSEVTRSMAGTSNWTQDGVVTYTMFVHGDAANANEPMYVAVNGSAVVNLAAGLALATEWTQVDIPLQDFSNKGVNLSNVSSLSIGLGNKSNPTAGGEGVVYIDDIRLYRPWP